MRCRPRGDLLLAWRSGNTAGAGAESCPPRNALRARDERRWTRPIELLVTDVVMPGMDGRELVDIAHREQPALPVLYISGYTDDAVARHGVERAAVDILEKPFACDALATRVRQLIDAAAPGPQPTSAPASA